MMNRMFRIADINFEVNCIHTYFERHSKEYYCIGQTKPDITISTTQKDIDDEIGYGEGVHAFRYLEHIAVSRLIAEKLYQYNAFVLHSATFDVDGVGVSFAAHSGTGKSTHMNLWQQLLGDRMTVVNGDKPIVRFFDDEPEQPYAYGTPWNGKEGLGCNMRTPLKHICFIERCAENSVEPIEKSEAIDRIFNQVYMPKDPIAAMNTIQLIDRLMSSCKLWKIKCNMDISAAETAYKGIFG